MTPHDLLANFETLAEAPNGIQRMRELVLEIAVRGKLVDQDPKDEPANNLLKRIKIEQMRWAKEGVWKLVKSIDPIRPDEATFEAPSGWEWARLPHIVSYRVGKTPPTKEPRFWGSGEIPWVSIGDMTDGGVVSTTSRTITSEAADEIFGYPPVPAGTLLMSFKLTIGKVAILGEPGFHNEAIISIRTADICTRDFLMRVLPALAKAGSSKSAVMGATLNGESLAMILVPVPPLAEQRRIVARVDELMALLDRLEAKHKDREAARAEARDSALAALHNAPTPEDVEVAWLRIQKRFHELFNTTEDVKPLRESLRQLAVNGRLVPQHSADTSAVQALTEIQDFRRRMVKAGKLRAGKPILPISEAQGSALLPDGWVLARLGGVLLDIQPGWSPQCEGWPRVGEEWGVLKVSACSWGRFLAEENKALPSALEVPEDLEVQPGDWIISRANTTELVGRSVLAVDCPPHLLLSDKTLRLVPMPGFSSTWGNLVNHAPSSRAHYEVNAGGTSASMRNISQEVIRNLVIPIPPIEEQARILSRVDDFMALLDRLLTSFHSQTQLSGAFAAAAIHHLDS